MANSKIPIAACRVAKGLTQAEMARKLGITPAWYNTIENDPSKMTLYFFYAILFITGFSVDDVILPEGLILN